MDPADASLGKLTLDRRLIKKAINQVTQLPNSVTITVSQGRPPMQPMQQQLNSVVKYLWQLNSVIGSRVRNGIVHPFTD